MANAGALYFDLGSKNEISGLSGSIVLRAENSEYTYTLLTHMEDWLTITSIEEG
jgi:hypothetical protein